MFSPPKTLRVISSFFYILLSVYISIEPGWTFNGVNDPASNSHINKARHELEKGGYASAVKTLTEAIKTSPDLAEAYFLRAKAFDILGQPMRALKDVTKYIELKPRDPKGYELKGDVNNFNLDHSEAIDSYNNALRLDSRSSGARIGRGLAYAAMEKYDLAIKDYEEVLKNNRLQHEALLNLGVALALSGRPDEALKKLTDALSLERDLDWRSRLNKMIDEISQSQARQPTKKMNVSPFNQAPKSILQKPW